MIRNNLEVLRESSIHAVNNEFVDGFARYYPEGEGHFELATGQVSVFSTQGQLRMNILAMWTDGIPNTMLFDHRTDSPQFVALDDVTEFRLRLFVQENVQIYSDRRGLTSWARKQTMSVLCGEMLSRDLTPNERNANEILAKAAKRILTAVRVESAAKLRLADTQSGLRRAAEILSGEIDSEHVLYESNMRGGFLACTSKITDILTAAVETIRALRSVGKAIEIFRAGARGSLAPRSPPAGPMPRSPPATPIRRSPRAAPIPRSPSPPAPIPRSPSPPAPIRRSPSPPASPPASSLIPLRRAGNSPLRERPQRTFRSVLGLGTFKRRLEMAEKRAQSPSPSLEKRARLVEPVEKRAPTSEPVDKRAPTSEPVDKRAPTSEPVDKRAPNVDRLARLADLVEEQARAAASPEEPSTPKTPGSRSRRSDSPEY